MKYKINLLPQRKLNIADKAFYFILNYLRYILVITQVLVIGVFFYRFSVDQEIIDTTEAVTQKQAILSAAKPIIDQAKEIDFKSADLTNIFAKQDYLMQMINYLLDRFPQVFTVSRLSVSSNGIAFDGTTKDIPTLQLFYNRLRKEGRFKKVRLININKKLEEASFSFDLQNFIFQ